MNSINKIFKEKKNILSIYFTAGFPELNDTSIIIEELERAGVEMIEIGMPFSDPLADGTVIQHSCEVALENGMTTKLLFEQLQKYDLSRSRLGVTRPLQKRGQKLSLPLILMGYLNPVLQYGVENFCKKANECGISGIILPDLPIEIYLDEYKMVFDKYDLKNIFLITPQTSEKRIRYIDKNSDGFIYMVSSSSTTGIVNGIDMEKEKYFQRIAEMKLKNPLMIGFGISDKKSFSKACEYANGAIIGSAFIKATSPDHFVTQPLQKRGKKIPNNISKQIGKFIKEIK